MFALTLFAGDAVVAADVAAGPAAVQPPRPPAPHVKTEMHVRIVKGQQNKAREAYQRGEIQSLSIIRRQVITTHQGRIISTQFVERPSAPVRYIYTFRVLGPDGKVSVVHVNAENARIIQFRGKR